MSSRRPLVDSTWFAAFVALLVALGAQVQLEAVLPAGVFDGWFSDAAARGATALAQFPRPAAPWQLVGWALAAPGGVLVAWALVRPGADRG